MSSDVKMASFHVEKASFGGPKRTTSMALRLILDRWMGFDTPIVLDRYALEVMATWGSCKQGVKGMFTLTMKSCRATSYDTIRL
jgi:hypothetical protein